MSVPLRKDDYEENLTTADLAQSKRPASSEDAARPILAERSSAEAVDLQTNTPMLDAAPQASPRRDSDATPLFPAGELEGLRSRWSEVQTAFVDEPRRAVEQADGLVASAMKRLAEVFAEERSKLEQQWDRGDNVSTEDLRIALQRYRSFFHRLLAI